MSSLDQALLLIRIALRSLRAHWIKSLIVGGILFFGTWLMVVGQAFLGSIESAALEADSRSSVRCPTSRTWRPCWAASTR